MKPVAEDTVGLAQTPRALGASSILDPVSPVAIPNVFLMTDSFNTGGSERQFAILAKSLNPDSFRAHIGCIQKRGPFLEGLEDVLQFSLGGSLYGPRSWWTRLALARYLRKQNIAIAHAFDFYTNLTLIPSARLAGVPVVIGSQRQLGDLLSVAKFRAQLAMFRWCDAVVCNSHAAANILLQEGLSADKIAVIANGLPNAAFEKAIPALPRHQSLIRVGMIARMNSQSKNHSIFLRAAALLCSRLTNIEFVLAGDGPLRWELERETEELGIKNYVRFLGDRRDIPEILASLDISVMPSSSESLSNVIIESMAAGVPVIATRVGGNLELLDNGRGVLISPGETALAGAIEALASNALTRIDTGRKAATYARENFALEVMRRKHEELYASLLERKRWKRSLVRGSWQDGKTRVAIVAASLRYVGGQSAQAELLMRQWKNDTQIDARFIPIDPEFPKILSWLNRIPGLRTIVREPIYLANLWRGLKDVDIVHIFSASYSSFLIATAPAWLIARARGKRTLIHYHSGEARDHLRRSETARRVLMKTDRLIVPSAYLANVFSEFGLHAGIIPNVVESSRFHFRLREPLRPHLICTRGFHPYYCVDVVVQAFAEIQRQFPEAALDLMGAGPTEPPVRKLVDQLHLKNVRFAGVASRAEIGRFYDQADIFINASRLDNMPVSILEAFASGTPVVTTEPEGMNYLVEHGRTGLLSLVGDAEALARNVIRLLNDPALASQLASSANQETSRYSWPVIRQQWLGLYASLAPSEVTARVI